MKLPISRGRLLAGAALGLGLAVSAQPAQAQCVVGASTVVCGPTTTTDTTYPANSPNDRHYEFATPFDINASVNGAVTGHGLAFTNTILGTADFIIVNTGGVQVDAGNTATAGGTAALNVTGIGATDINYSGAGNVTNLGTGGNGLDILSTGTGNIVANVGGNTTSSTGIGIAGGNAIIAHNSGTAGNINLTTAAGTTARAEWVGVWARQESTSSGNITLTNNGSVLSRTGLPNTLNWGVVGENAGSGSLTVINNGAVGTAADRAQITGIYASISNAGSTAPLSVTGSGAVFSAGTGIDVENNGTGTTTVNYTGAVNTTGATGVEVDATTGATNVTLGAVTAATNAVDVSSTGAQTIALNGVTTGTTGSGLVSGTTGARTITVGAGGNVTGGTQAILLTGTGTAGITNGGIIGAASTGLALNAAAAGATTLTNQAAGTVNGRATFSANADTFTNSGIWNTQGITDFGAGADLLNNTGTGTINILGNTTFANLETFTNTGRINLNNFVLTGPAIAFTNSGFIDTSGNAGLAGFTAFNNAGTLDLAPGTFLVPAATFTNSGTILADEGASTISGQTSFANTGTIDLQDGVPNDTLTINSNFVGSGGSNLLVDYLAGDADVLVINGAASGATTINAAYLGGGFDFDGSLVVDTTTSTANAFVLGAVTGENPLVDVRLVQDGADYFLLAVPTAAAFSPLVVPAFATDIWYQSADEVFAETVKPATTEGISFWGNGYISRDSYGDADVDFDVDVDDLDLDFDFDGDVKTKRHGLQLGVDYGFGGGRIGLTGGYGWAKGNGDADADVKAKGWNLGVYGQFGGLTGFHGEFLVKHDRYDAEFDDGAFDGVDFDIRSTGFDGSLGYRFGFGGGATMDIHGGLSHVRTKVDDIEAFGFNYDLAKMTSTRGRLGVRGIFGGSLAPYVDATVYREFNGDGDFELDDGDEIFGFDTNGKATWVRLEAGLSGNNGPGPILAAWGDLGDRKGLGLRAGWRLGGRVSEAVVPAPAPYVAPPAPPPPATQTCPDGSVILATDMCPPPPPPPPPPPEPERG